MFDGDVAGEGYVMELTRVWAHDPALQPRLGDLLGGATETAGLSLRQRAVLVTATASTIRDPYCGLAWGRRLADETSADVAAGLLRGDDAALDPADQALARWARRAAGRPHETTAADVDDLRQAGFDDAQILGITVYVAGRIAFSTVNAALGARPDPELLAAAPPQVRDAVAAYTAAP
ncbi:hypothetical protein GH723_07430 [Actinomarinicola tropica]|uniref:Carboxymuconolactone decarboxylase-like domain-containing protein n=2 Tax=Actinomarinicola tropica TaxID=2789776 RepID=A0A5Q2RS70_9ACTN|nr:hypothetical protein GH723_07430 [Actinomarinicola tropica]